MKPVMALRRRPGTRAIVSELNPSASSTAPVGSEKLSGDGVDPVFEELGQEKLDIQPPSPVPARYCLSDGSGDDSIQGESPLQQDSMEEDSLSEYDNAVSVEEEEEEQHDYEEDEELQTEADRMTYYVHCCPEDESYMEGMDCHEGADGAECPGTSRDVRESCKPEEAWEHSEGFYKVLQQDATTTVYKRPEPITETTFVQAPMAEDEEDEEETEEEAEEEDSEEEDNVGFFHYKGKEAELNNNEIPSKGADDFPRDGKSCPQESSCAKVGQESDAVSNYRRNQDIPKNPRNVPQGSSCLPRDRIERVREECASDCPKDCDVFVVRESRGNPRQSFRYRGHQSERVHKRDTAYQDPSRVSNKAKSANPEDRGIWKKRHLLKYSREDDRDGNGKLSHEQSKSPGDSKNRGQGHPVCSHKPKGEKERKSIGDVEEEQIENEVKTKLKIAPNNSGSNKGSPDQTKNGKEAPDNSRTSSTSSDRRNSQSRAHVNTPVQSPDKRLHKGLTKPVETGKTRPSQEQVSQSSPEESNTGPPSGQKRPQAQRNPSFPSFVDIPGPCEPEDLINGIIFAANYLGSTQVLSDRNPSKSVRMKQAQEALDCVKSVEGEAQSLTEIDLFISTKAIKVLNADTQETMMDNALRTISYIADIGDVVVLMARRRLSNSSSLDCTDSGLSTESRKQYRMMCYVFESEDAQRRAQSIGQAFSMAYQEFLRDNGINPKDLSQKDYSDILSTQEMYNDDLIHFSNSENCKELQLEKQKGEMLGVVIVESGWGSILPTVILACMLNNGLAARSGKLNVGDQIMAVNDTSLVGLPLATCQGIIKSLKNHVQVKLSVVSCPPVTTVLIKRPDLQYQLGFSVQNGIICSLMRGGIAERGGVRVGHRIIEINGQSVVAMAHEKIVHALSVSVGEINMKTMPAVMFRLLTGQEPSVHIRNHKPGLFLQLKKKKKVYSSS
ncbi:amyloid beta A4 precursor protein-binding family A member 2 [Sinocyclocheilus grahami]|uniref:amyloid beta A4 precursor protein-binding family A member 2 n=1 Tax=Sinocyclocheilus grahami TaxID=75366 RepID=UPI0007AD568E|nr:PREDICTED: amyloid beta A4 precursor protein-binding family A member 2-like [Sinocyclocheilus grahami]